MLGLKGFGLGFVGFWMSGFSVLRLRIGMFSNSGFEALNPFQDPLTPRPGVHQALNVVSHARRTPPPCIKGLGSGV